MIKVCRMSKKWLTELEMIKVVKTTKQKKKYGWKDVAVSVEEVDPDTHSPNELVERRGHIDNYPFKKGSQRLDEGPYFHVTLEYVV